MKDSYRRFEEIDELSEDLRFSEHTQDEIDNIIEKIIPLLKLQHSKYIKIERKQKLEKLYKK